MKFDSEIIAYIEGEKFSNGLDIDFSSEKHILKSRIEKVLEITKGKKVIHIGFADHLPLIDDKIATNRWLHGLLINNCSRCVGIDINEEAVKYLQNKHTISDIYLADVEDEKSIKKIIDNEKWDYILLGEVIEHIDNPVDFLKHIHANFGKHAKHIIITAPNVFNSLTINDIKRNKENINTDHRYWFSPFTLTKILSISGFKDFEISFVDQVKLPFFQALRKRLNMILKKQVFLQAKFFSTLLVTSKFY